MVLSDLVQGQTAVIAELHINGAERNRLMDLGLLPGTPISVAFRAPLGSPTAYEVRGTLIALRPSQASRIEVEVS